MSVGLRRWVLPLLSNLGLKSIKFLDGVNCIEPKGVKYRKPIEDSYEEIDCPYYLEKGFAGAMSPAFDDEFFDMF